MRAALDPEPTLMCQMGAHNETAIFISLISVLLLGAVTLGAIAYLLARPVPPRLESSLCNPPMPISLSDPPPRRTNIPSPQWSLLLMAFLVAFVATLGSLFFSEIMKLEPCVLCWYQRIAMFPLVPILAIGLYSQDSGGIKYAMPLAGAGWLAAFYHWLLYSGYIPKGLQPCGKGPSCAEVSLELGGLVTIPMLSLASFSIIIILLLLATRKGGSQ